MSRKRQHDALWQIQQQNKLHIIQRLSRTGDDRPAQAQSIIERQCCPRPQGNSGFIGEQMAADQPQKKRCTMSSAE